MSPRLPRSHSAAVLAAAQLRFSALEELRASLHPACSARSPPQLPPLLRLRLTAPAEASTSTLERVPNLEPVLPVLHQASRARSSTTLSQLVVVTRREAG